jgi:hypothetical protein
VTFEELNQTKKAVTKKKGIQDTEARLGEFFKKWERKVVHGVCIKGTNKTNKTRSCGHRGKI